MSRFVEKEIQKMIEKGREAPYIAKTLLQKKSISKNTSHFLAVCRFMYQSGLYKLLIKTAVSRLKKKEVIPWAFIIEILESHKIETAKEKRKYFIEGIIEQDQWDALLTSYRWNKYHPELLTIQKKTIEKINRQRNQHYIQLMKDLEFIQAQGVLKKEEEILKELKKIDPENPKIQEKWLEFREKWGRSIIDQKKTHLFNKSDLTTIPSEKEKKQAEQITQSIKTILKKKPGAADDMALLLFFIGYPSLAVQILKNNLPSISSEWLYLDLLLQSELYLDCLSFVDIMEIKYSEDPETIFALTYIRAKAYHGLGKKKKAKEILSDLLEVRPNYRLTHYLLKQWEKGASNFD